MAEQNKVKEDINNCAGGCLFTIIALFFMTIAICAFDLLIKLGAGGLIAWGVLVGILFWIATYVTKSYRKGSW